MTQPITLRPEVAAFAALMEQQLRANDHKGGWKNDRATALWSRMTEEAVELFAAVEARTLDRPKVAKEAADVANFAMMIADVMGGLSVTAPIDPPGDAIDRIARKLAAADGLIWTEVCGFEADPVGGDCDSSTCMGANFEDHDPDYARDQYRKYARVAFASGEIADDVTTQALAGEAA